MRHAKTVVVIEKNLLDVNTKVLGAFVQFFSKLYFFAVRVLPGFKKSELDDSTHQK